MHEIINILESIRPEFSFSDTDDFFAEGMLDSFDLVTLISTLDQIYSISIQGTDIIPENFKNVRSISFLLGNYGVSL